MTGLADNRVRIRRQGVNAGATGEAEHLNLDRLSVVRSEHLLAVIIGCVMQNIGPMLAITDILFGLRFIP